MMKKLLYAPLIVLVAALLSFSFVTCGSDDTDPQPTPDGTMRPVDAGLITQNRLDDGSVLLSVGEIFYAETYRWYCDGEQVQATAPRPSSMSWPSQFIIHNYYGSLKIPVQRTKQNF